MLLFDLIFFGRVKILIINATLIIKIMSRKIRLSLSLLLLFLRRRISSLTQCICVKLYERMTAGFHSFKVQTQVYMKDILVQFTMICTKLM